MEKNIFGLPEYDLDEPFVEENVAGLSEKDRRRIELINSMVEQEASDTEKSPPPVMEVETTAEEREEKRKQALLKIAWSEVTGQEGKDIEHSWKDYFNSLPDEKMSMLSALHPAMFKKIVKDALEPKLVDLMAEDKQPTLADVEEIEPAVLEKFKQELSRRKSQPPKAGDFFQTGT
ncbi:MAG: hypothetical protein PHC70_00335 [Patescibacteria group bacterium]|nr:hypothetical protein [Patescibacteria group bacterium]